MNITKEQINELLKKSNELLKKGNELKLDYTDAFKLEVGKWYKTNEGAICYNGGENPNYGFNSNDNGNCFIYDCFWFWDGLWTLATEQEVRDALIKEAKKRGFKDGVRYDATNVGFSSQTNKLIRGSEFEYKEYFNTLTLGDWIIFKDGKWAEVKEEAKKGYVKTILEYTLDYTSTEYKELKGVWTDSAEYTKQLEVKEITLNGVKYKQKKKQ